MKNLFFVIAIFFAINTSAQITNIEHFFVSSPNAKKLFYFFRDNFHLTVEWNYSEWNGFASGAVILGETPLEFLRFAKDTSTKTYFAGIALEPVVRVNKLIEVYDSLHVNYGEMYVDTFTEDNVKDTGYTNLRIKNALPDNIYFFTCDYKYRTEMDTMEMKASDSLKAIHGGTLGIVALKEIVVGCNDLSAYSHELSKLPGIRYQNDELFTFSRGPAIRLVKASQAGVQKIVVRVESLAKAKNFLRQRKMLEANTSHSVMIDQESVGGLEIELTDK